MDPLRTIDQDISFGLSRADMLLLVLFSVLALSFFVPLSSNSFWQDDFVFLSSSGDSSIIDIAASFAFWNTGELGFYRPISTNLYFWLGKYIFGLEASRFLSFNIFVHSINCFLVYVILKNLTSDRFLSFVTSLSYLLSRVHVESLMWVSGFQEISMTFFVLLCVVLYVSIPDSKNATRSVSLSIVYIMSLMCKEMAIIVPIILFIYDALYDRSTGLKGFMLPFIRRTWYFWSISLVYLVFRINSILNVSTETSSGYSVILDYFVLNKYYWGTYWYFEVFLDPIKRFTDEICEDCFKIILLISWFLLALIWFIVFWLKADERVISVRKSHIRMFVFGIAWYVSSFLPVLFIGNFAAYLFMLPSVGLTVVLCSLLGSFWFIIAEKYGASRVIIAVIISLSMIGSSYLSTPKIIQSSAVFWGGADARLTLDKLMLVCPKLPPDATVALVGFPREVWWENRAEAAIRVMYRRNDINVREFPVGAFTGDVPTLLWEEPGKVVVVKGCR